MAKLSVEEQVFKLPINIEENGTIVKTLATADTYVDKNIEITIETPDASFEVKDAGSIEAVVSSKDTTYTSETETPYAIEIAANASTADATVGVKNAGFAAASDVVTVDGLTAEENTKTIYVKEGHLSGSGEASASSESVKMTKASADAEGFIVKASAAGGASVDVAGWLPVGAEADASGDAYYAIQKASFANTGSADAEELNAPILVEGGYLYINEGYVKDSKISLATLVPDDAVIPNVVEGKSDLMYNTVAAYDSDGKLIAGTMGDAELGAITAEDAEATISTVEVTVLEDESAFKVSGSQAISGNASVSISKRGLAETSLSQTGVIEGQADVDATIAKVGLATEVSSEDVEVTPVISKNAASSGKFGDIVTVQPAEGRFVAVNTAAITASATVSPVVATEGYGTADVFDATGATVKAGAAASGIYYVPVESATHTAEAGEATIVKASATVTSDAEATGGFDGNLTQGILSTEPTSGEYIKISTSSSATKGSVSGVVTCTSTEGYIEAGSKTATISGEVDVEIAEASDKYIRVYDGSLL